MSRSVPTTSPGGVDDPGPDPGASGIPVRRLRKDQALAAARRLVDQSLADIDQAARRLVSAGPGHGIDFSLLWATADDTRAGLAVRQAVLAVPGRGRTAMLFISEPAPRGDPGGELQGRRERTRILETLCGDLAREMPDRIRLVQALPSPGDTWSIEPMAGAGFLHVGTLSYLRRPGGGRLPEPVRAALESPWPTDIAMDRCSDLARTPRADPMHTAAPLFVAALDATYESTLDCPELCGLRDTADVLESHRATGVFDPRLWWLLRQEGRPCGCMLFNRCPEQRTIELVYLGLAPAVRGRGVASMLLARGLAELHRLHPSWDITCAVDDRNEPARRLYERFGFAAFSRRVAMVKPITPAKS